MEAIIGQYGSYHEGKKMEVEGEHQKNGRMCFFDLWKTLSRQFSVICEG